MRKINNPYDEDINMCFGCGKKNPIGMKLEFLDFDKSVRARWMPTELYQGYPNVLHGGIIAALLDEVGAWYVSVKIGTAGVTSEMNIKYLNPVYINKGSVELEADMSELSGRQAVINCRLYDGNGKACAEAIAIYTIFPVEVAKRKFRYPGKEAFLE